MAERKYYWLKLMKDFFSKPKIKKLRRIAGGDTYTIIYLKLQLLSLDNDGVLVYQHIEDDFIEEMALTIDEDIDNVNVTINYLLHQGMLEPLNENEFLMTETQTLIGSETSVAKRVRKHREEKKALQCNTDVTKCNVEIEIEKDKEIDKELEIEKESNICVLDEIESEFENVWKIYKKKTDKTKSLKAYKKARKGYKLSDGTKYDPIDYETIYNGIQRYNDYLEAKNTELQYVKMFSTWLNGRCWENDYTIEESNKDWSFMDL